MDDPVAAEIPEAPAGVAPDRAEAVSALLGLLVLVTGGTVLAAALAPVLVTVGAGLLLLGCALVGLRYLP